MNYSYERSLHWSKHIKSPATLTNLIFHDFGQPSQRIHDIHKLCHLLIKALYIQGNNYHQPVYNWAPQIPVEVLRYNPLAATSRLNLLTTAGKVTLWVPQLMLFPLEMFVFAAKGMDIKHINAP